MAAPERMTTFVSGRVQGVGFRWWTRARALELGLTGYARNTGDRRVEVRAEGPRESLDALLALIGEYPSSTGRPGRVSAHSTPSYAAATGEFDRFRER